MKVLVVHNRYRSALPSGENRVVDDEVAMLREAGIEVETFFRDSDDIEQFSLLQKAELAVGPIYHASGVRAFKDTVRRFRPDVVHLHNPYPLISPQVVREAKKAGVPVVQTVHNYRLMCPAGVFFRDGKVCEDCVGRRVPTPAIRHGCYRGSRSQSAVMAAALGLHRNTWQQVDRYLPVSNFLAAQIQRAGIPATRIRVKPNSVPDPGPATPPGSGFLYLGRLDPEKGVMLLLDAWDRSGLGAGSTLTIAGDGPLRDDVARRSAASPGVRFLGQVSRAEVQTLILDCAVVVVPSRWFEGFPTTVLEAMSHGRPVLGCRVGSIEEAVAGYGWLAEPTTESLAAALPAVATSRDLPERGRLARQRFRHFRSDTVAAQLIGAYTDLQNSKSRPPSLRADC